MRNNAKYQHGMRHKKTIYSAEIILSILLDAVPPVTSAVDVGCGVGTWLSVLREKGVNNILGLDGEWVDKKYLEIPLQNFKAFDLNKPPELGGRYDLAISLEVAEHLSPGSAFSFVELLTGLSDIVLFSAAIPGQLGVNHINEQWPDYWAGHFRSFGYRCLDLFRMRIWRDEKIPFWYKQNLLLYVKQERISDIHFEDNFVEYDDGAVPLSLVHPDLHLYRMEIMKNLSVLEGLKIFLKSILHKVR